MQLTGNLLKIIENEEMIHFRPSRIFYLNFKRNKHKDTRITKPSKTPINLFSTNFQLVSESKAAHS